MAKKAGRAVQARKGENRVLESFSPLLAYRCGGAVGGGVEPLGLLEFGLSVGGGVVLPVGGGVLVLPGGGGVVLPVGGGVVPLAPGFTVEGLALPGLPLPGLFEFGVVAGLEAPGAVLPGFEFGGVAFGLVPFGLEVLPGEPEPAPGVWGEA